MNRLGRKDRSKCKTTKEKSLISLKLYIYTNKSSQSLFLQHKAPLILQYIITQPTTPSRKRPKLLKTYLAPRDCHLV